MTDERTDLYTILGLPPQATQDQITHAYRGLLRQHHPDTRDLTATAQAAASDAVLQHVSLTPVAVEPLWSLTRTLGLMPMSTGRGR